MITELGRKIAVKIKGVPLAPWYWVLLSIVVLYIDYQTGPRFYFPILYLLPIFLASWNHGQWWGIGLAVALSGIRIVFSYFWVVPHFSMVEILINSLVRCFVFVLFALLLSQVSRQKRKLEKELKTLKGILPICGHCKRIRNEDDTWDSLEQYISSRSEASFSHGLCPDCAKKYYPEYYDE